MIICVDSSFLVSSYLSDSHSVEADRRRLNQDALRITPLNRSEFVHAVFRQVFQGAINLGQANDLIEVFEQDVANGLWISTNFPDEAWPTSVQLARRHGPALGVRTLDTLHVACALELRADRFWTFDDRQIRLAQAAGLDTTA